MSYLAIPEDAVLVQLTVDTPKGRRVFSFANQYGLPLKEDDRLSVQQAEDGTWQVVVKRSLVEETLSLAAYAKHQMRQPITDDLLNVATDQWQRATLWFKKDPEGLLLVDDLSVIHDEV